MSNIISNIIKRNFFEINFTNNKNKFYLNFFKSGIYILNLQKNYIHCAEVQKAYQFFKFISPAAQLYKLVAFRLSKGKEFSNKFPLASLSVHYIVILVL